MANLGNTLVNGILRVNGKIIVGESITAPSFIGTCTGSIKALSVSGRTITYTKGDDTTGTITTQDTTYTAGGGLNLSGTEFSNTGVRSVATGSTNGTISVNTNGTATEVAVAGLGSIAYKSSLTKSDVGLENVDNTADANKNVLTATKLAAAKTISLTGDVTGSTSFDGSDNASITTVVGNDSHSHTATTLPVITGLSRSEKTITTTSTGWVTIAKTSANTEIWSCKLLLEVTGDNDCIQSIKMDIAGGGLRYPTARIMIQNTDIYYASDVGLFYPKAKNNGYGSGVEIYLTGESKSKSIKVVLLESENVELTNLNGSRVYNSTYHSIWTDGMDRNGVLSFNKYTSGNTDNAQFADNVLVEDSAFVSGEAIDGEDIISLASDGKLYKITNTTVSFDIKNCLIAKNRTYSSQNGNPSLLFMSKSSPSWNLSLTTGKATYVEGSISNNGMFVSNGTITNTLTNGNAYIRLGIALSSNKIYLDRNNYCFKLNSNGEIISFNGLPTGAVTSVDSGKTCELDTP